MNSVIFKDANTVRAEISKFGNITVDKYIHIQQEIAKYGEVAEMYYMQQAREDRVHKAVAQQFGLTAEELTKQLGVGINGNI